MAETIQQIQRRPEYLELFEKGILDALLGQYTEDEGWSGGIVWDPQYFQIPQYQIAGRSELETLPEQALMGDANANGVPDFLERYQPYFQQAGEFMTGGQESLYRGLGALGDAISYFGPAAQYVSGGAGMYDPSQYISQFTSPYTESVIDASMRSIDREADAARQRAAREAVGAGAFGGSREGIQRAELERKIMETKADQEAKLRQAGYETALKSSMDAYQQAATRGLEAGRLMGGLGQSMGQLGSTFGTLGQQYGQLSGTTADIGRVYSALAPADLATMAQFGEAARQYQQSLLDTARQEAMRPTQQALLPYNYAYSALSGTPSASLYNEYTTTTQPAANPYLSGLGAYTALQGVYGQQ